MYLWKAARFQLKVGRARIMKFLAGLNESYEITRRQIIMKKVFPSLFDVYNTYFFVIIPVLFQIPASSHTIVGHTLIESYSIEEVLVSVQYHIITYDMCVLFLSLEHLHLHHSHSPDRYDVELKVPSSKSRTSFSMKNSSRCTSSSLKSLQTEGSRGTKAVEAFDFDFNGFDFGF